MRPTEHRPLGEILLRARVITPPQLEQAVAFQRQHGGRLGEALVRLGFATEDDVAWALSAQLGLPYVHLRPDMLDPEVLRLLPADEQRRLGVVPLLAGEGEVAVADPTDRRVLAEVERLSGLRPSPVVALASNIREVLEAVGQASPPPADGDLPLRLVLSNAALKGATHVYVEPLAGRAVRVRYRTVVGVFPAEGPSVPWESLAALAGRAGADGVVRLEVVLADRAVEAALHPVRTRWGVALAGPLSPIVEEPLADDAGLPEELWQSALGAVAHGGLLVVACSDARLRVRLMRSVAARLASRWGGVVVLAGAAGHRPLPGVVESPAQDAARWQRARPDTLVAEVATPEALACVAAAAWPGQKLVVGVAGHRARHARAVLPGGTLPLRGVLAALPVPALCRCASGHHARPPWPAGEGPTRWASPKGCEACRYTGFGGEATVFEWEPAEGAGVPMELSARALAESFRVSPEHLTPLLEG
ncbi:MAG: hypothetical protein RMM30_03350 [Armatimonadota bacterium]|nr:hypothetical protein [Armatimonadota bacterium]MDW8155605.1 hypothetical protein [Armatimonadota bacterium]